MKYLFDKVSEKCSKITTNSYSTSFSLGIRFLARKFHQPIYSIYGFVRFADEIVDSFHDYDKAHLLKRFEADTFQAIEEKISLNPILNSYQEVVNKYHIEDEITKTFLRSMEMDLSQSNYNREGYEEYILGSAEVVGLMCLRVFCEGDDEKYEQLKPYAMKLGSAFQKINFLRDIRADYAEMGRTYFPGINLNHFTNEDKINIEEDIKKDFQMGFEGIKRLPKDARLGIYVAYVYYYSLFKKIQNTPVSRIMDQRIRIQNRKKYTLFVSCYFRHQLNIL